MEKEELFKSRKSSTNSYNSKTKDECVNKLFDLKREVFKQLKAKNNKITINKIGKT